MIDIHAAWNNATQEWEGTVEDMPRPCLRARTLPALREAITQMMGYHLPRRGRPPAFRLIVLARNRTPAPTIH